MMMLVPPRGLHSLPALLIVGVVLSATLVSAAVNHENILFKPHVPSALRSAPVDTGNDAITQRPDIMSSTSASGNVEQRDTIRFLRWLHNWQHPADCAARPVAFFAGHEHGTGSQLHVMAHSLLRAVSTGRTFVAAMPRGNVPFVSRRRCPAGQYDCVFRPISGCAAHAYPGRNKQSSSARREGEVIFEDCVKLDPAALASRAGLEGRGYGQEFFQSATTWYLARPNAASAAFARHVAREIGFLGAGGDAAAGGAVGVHVRWTDKHEGVQHPVEAYADAVNHLIAAHGFSYVQRHNFEIDPL